MLDKPLKLKRTRQFVEWYESLPDTFRARVDARIDHLHIGHFGKSESLGSGLFELKWKNGLRVYFTRTKVGGIDVLLLLGGNKSTQDADIRLARRLLTLFSLGNMRSKTRRKAAQRLQLSDHDTSKTLGDVDLVLRTFMECLQEGDAESAREILAASLRHLNKSELARRYHIPRRTTYNLLDKKSLPTLSLIAKICHAIKQESSRPRTL